MQFTSLFSASAPTSSLKKEKEEEGTESTTFFHASSIYRVTLISLDSSLWHSPWDTLHPDKKVESSLVKYSDLQEERATYIKTMLIYFCNLAKK